MNNDIVVSVIIPVYNCEDYILRAIESVIAQKIDKIEIVVVDDCSTDATVEIVEKKFAAYHNIRIIRHSENQKLGAARNTGIQESRGQYVFFLDSDDWILENGLQHMLQVAISNDAEVVACGVQRISSSNEVTPYHSEEFRSTGGEVGLTYFSKYMIGALACNKLYKKSFIDEFSIRFTPKYFHEDIIFTAHIALYSKNYISIPNIYLNYFHNHASITQKKPVKLHLLSYFNLYKEMGNYYAELKRLNVVTDPKLFYDLANSYGTYEVIPKFRKYREVYGKDKFEKDVFDAAYEILGSEGFGLASLICFTLTL